MATPASSANAGALPLAGIRVLDMTRVLAGVSLIKHEADSTVRNDQSGTASYRLFDDNGELIDRRADVIKIEHPTRGDDTREWGPPYASYTEESGKQGSGESAYFLGVNRNKKSLGLSFQHKAGVDILHKLAKECDVLVENYLPGSLKKYGMDYESVAKINPALIYASITGYGQTGPYSSRAGYDVMVEA
ncbi:hypothetical protein LTR42_011232 [Elasticomyces elasticus]|nr:hypothetical protein LTR42_011232 [Elasticomyces elasticus]